MKQNIGRRSPATWRSCFLCLAAAGGFLLGIPLCAQNTVPATSRVLLPCEVEGLTLWWALSSAAKIQPDQPPPQEQGKSIVMSCARNEREAAQIVVRSTRRLEDVRISCATLTGPNSAVIASGGIELLQVMYLDLSKPSDRGSLKGLCPDPLLPMEGPLELKPDFNHAFWIRVFAPSNSPPGSYRGSVQVQGKGFQTRVPVELTVYDFALPDRMSCTTAFGFSPGNVFRYHGLRNDLEKRQVLNKYWATLAAHHVSPYDPAPIDPIQVKWPDIHPPQTTWDNWTGLRIVNNEAHSGEGALLIYDDKVNENVTAGYEPLIKIPAKGLRVRCWYRTAVPGHRFIVTLTHYDAQKKWMSGRNNDITLRGSGQWQNIDQLLTDFPSGAEYVRFDARATIWTDRGEKIGLVWLDDISISDPETGKELVLGGDFERKPRTEPVVPLEQLKVQFDFSAWDRAMTKAIDRNHFNSFRLHIPGIGGGTFHEITPPGLLGFGEDTPEYPALFDSYCRQLQAHLEAKGWLKEAYIYWFDEPSADQYPFVMNGFAKLKRSCPRIARMLTEQVEPALLGGPDIWCSISDSYDHRRAEERRKHGEKFWWYVCTGPKAPYSGLFMDHPAPEMRIWLWQTFQRNIEGILVWETTYWTSSAAYPDPKRPQNPYTDPMSWTSGYSTPAGERRPWGNGDGRFIYPPLKAADGGSDVPVLDGPVDSIRWEHLRDGIEDYEYLCILRKRLAEHQNTLSPDSYQKYARLLVVPESITRSLTEFAPDGAPLEQQRQQIALAIESLR
jgi:hypothetical protein